MRHVRAAAGLTLAMAVPWAAAFHARPVVVAAIAIICEATVAVAGHRLTSFADNNSLSRLAQLAWLSVLGLLGWLIAGGLLLLIISALIAGIGAGAATAFAIRTWQRGPSEPASPASLIAAASVVAFCMLLIFKKSMTADYLLFASIIMAGVGAASWIQSRRRKPA